MDPSLKAHVDQVVQTPLEILDFETYSTLQRLASAGFIQLSAKPKEVVFQSHLIQSNRHGLKQHQLEEATAFYKEAERKLRMANLLKSGDFLLEALPAAREALSKSLRICKTLEREVDDKGLRLKEDQENPEDPEAFINLLSLWIQEIGDVVTQLTLGVQPT